jgi:hypothetical protein
MSHWAVGEFVTALKLTTQALEPGTRTIFDQDSAPTSWTRDTSVDDRVIRIVSGALVHGGSWTISGLSEAAHTHNTTFGGPSANAAADVFFDFPPPSLPTTTHTHSGTSSSLAPSVTSDGTWRPLHRDVILCAKDDIRFAVGEEANSPKLNNALLAIGTRWVFDNDTAPTSWTRDVTINDRMVMIESGTRSHDGSWTISGLTMAHTHTTTTGVESATIGGGSAFSGAILWADTSHTHTGTSGGPSVTTITSDGTWRPLHRDLIVCSKDASPALFSLNEVATASKFNTHTLEAATRTVFDQSAAPAGWTRDTSLNDRLLRIVSGARADGGSWTVSGLSGASHTHTTTTGGPSATLSRTTGPEVTPAGTHTHTGTSDASTAPISSDGSWRPAVRDMILCTKN